MAMMTPQAFIDHIDHEIARKFATDILNLLEPAKPKPKAEPEPEAKKKARDGKEENEEK